jgi:hypothetical protein
MNRHQLHQRRCGVARGCAFACIGADELFECIGSRGWKLIEWNFASRQHHPHRLSPSKQRRARQARVAGQLDFPIVLWRLSRAGKDFGIGIK